MRARSAYAPTRYLFMAAICAATRCGAYSGRCQRIAWNTSPPLGVLQLRHHLVHLGLDLAAACRWPSVLDMSTASLTQRLPRQ